MINVKSNPGMPACTAILDGEIVINIGGRSPVWVQYLAEHHNTQLFIMIQDLLKGAIDEQHAIALYHSVRESNRRKP